MEFDQRTLQQEETVSLTHTLRSRPQTKKELVQKEETR